MPFILTSIWKVAWSTYRRSSPVTLSYGTAIVSVPFSLLRKRSRLMQILFYSAIHAVDKVHNGKGDSSVMYIPVCPVTELNAKYTARQRDTFLAGIPAPDFPGGKGESQHVGRATAEYIAGKTNNLGLSSMGLSKLTKLEGEKLPGAERMIQRANQLLGFA